MERKAQRRPLFALTKTPRRRQCNSVVTNNNYIGKLISRLWVPSYYYPGSKITARFRITIASRGS